MRKRLLGKPAPRKSLRAAIALAVAFGTTAFLVLPVAASTPPASPAVTREATASDDVRPGRFSFSVARFHYSVTTRGVGLRSAPHRAPQRFQLRLDRGAWIERLWYLPLEHDIVLIYEDTDGEGGAATVVRLTGEKLQARWSAHIPSFNIGEGVVDGDHLYVTALGFIAKLSLITGRYAWVHKDLYADGRFNSFKRPTIKDRVVTFTDGANTITVDKQSGVLVP